MSETSGSESPVPSWEALEQAYDELGLNDASEEALDNDSIADAQFKLAQQIDAQNG